MKTTASLSDLRDIRDACRYWYEYALAHGAPPDTCETYLAGWRGVAGAICEVNH